MSSNPIYPCIHPSIHLYSYLYPSLWLYRSTSSLFIYLPVCLSLTNELNSYRSIDSWLHRSIHPFGDLPDLSVYLPTYLAVCQCIYPAINLSSYPSIHVSIYQQIHLSIHPCVHPSIHPPIHPSSHPSSHSSIPLSICLSIYLLVYRHIYLPTYFLSIYRSIYLPTYPSMYIRLSIHLSIHPSIYSCIYRSIHLSIHPSIHPSVIYRASATTGLLCQASWPAQRSRPPLAQTFAGIETQLQQASLPTVAASCSKYLKRALMALVLVVLR